MELDITEQGYDDAPPAMTNEEVLEDALDWTRDYVDYLESVNWKLWLGLAVSLCVNVGLGVALWLTVR